MLIKRPRGTTQVLNRNHEDGFLPLPIRVESTRHNGHLYASIVTAWELTPEELKQLQAGGVIEISLMTPQMVGILPSVVPSDDPITPTNLQTLKADVESAIAKLQSHFQRTVNDSKSAAWEGDAEARKAKHWAYGNLSVIEDIKEKMKGVG